MVYKWALNVCRHEKYGKIHYCVVAKYHLLHENSTEISYKTNESSKTKTKTKNEFGGRKSMRRKSNSKTLKMPFQYRLLAIGMAFFLSLSFVHKKIIKKTSLHNILQQLCASEIEKQEKCCEETMERKKGER